MASVIDVVVAAATAIWTGIISMLGTLGDLIFTVTESTGAISGLTPFGNVIAILLGVALATFIFGFAAKLIQRLTKVSK